jgi:hypothetical protein
MNTGQEEMEVKLDSNKEEIQASKGAMKEGMKTDEEEMKAAVSAILQEKNSWQYETKGCPEKREAIAEGIKVVTERQEVLNEGAAVGNIGAMEDRYGERHLAQWLSRQPKKRCPQKLAANRGWLTRSAVLALRKRLSSTRPGNILGNDIGDEAGDSSCVW